MTHEYRNIPYSPARLMVSKDGRIRNQLNNPIPVITNNTTGKPMAYFEWYSGLDYHDLAKVILHTYSPLNFSIKFYDYVSVLYRDGDLTNVNLVNLVWKLPVGFNVDNNTDFAIIPGYTDYVIGKDGRVFYRVNGEMVTTVTKQDGYDYVKICGDLGQLSGFIPIQRLMALAWLDYPANHGSLMVRYKNGDIKDNSIKNLEWAEMVNDNIHNSAVLVKDLRDSNVKEYPSIDECAKAIGVSKEHINFRIKKGNQALYSDEYLFKLKSDVSDWRDVGADERHLNQVSAPVLVRDVKTYEVIEYPNLIACSKAIGISKDALYYRLGRRDQAAWDDDKQYKYKADRSPWTIPEVVEPSVSIRPNKRVVLVRNAITGVVREYESIAQCAIDLNLSASAVFVRTSSRGQRLFPGNMQFKLKSDADKWKEFSTTDLDGGENKKVIIATKVDTGEELEFSSYVECQNALGVSASLLNFRLLHARDKEKAYKGYTFKFK